MSGSTGRETVVYFLSQIGSTVAGFAATWFIANRLGASVLGRYSVVIALLFWLGIPMGAVDNSIKKRVSENVEPAAYLGAGNALNLLVTGVVVAGLFLFSGVVNGLVGAPIAHLIAALVVARSVFDAVISSLRGQKRVGVTGWIKTLERVVRAGLQIGLIVLTSATIAGLVGLYAVALVLGAIVGIAFFRIRPARWTMNHVRSLVEFGAFASLGTIRTRAFAWMDTMVMSFFTGATPAIVGLLVLGPTATVTFTEIGIYEVAWSIASMLVLINLAIKQTLFPEISELGVEADFDRVRHLIDEGLTYTGIFAIPGAFGALVVGSTLLTIFRPVFARGGTILVILILTRLFAAYGVQLTNAISALDRPDITFKINAVFIGSNFVLNVGLIAWLGWYGAALATLLSSLGMVGMAGWQLHALIDGISVPIGEIGRQFVASVVMVLVILGVQRHLDGTLVSAFVLVAIGAAVYSVVLLAVSDRIRTKMVAVLPA